MGDRLFSPKVANMTDEDVAEYPRSITKEESLVMGYGASRIVYKDMQSIPRDAYMMAEIFLRDLADKLVDEIDLHGSDYPLHASYAVVPGNVQDATSSAE